MEIRVRQVRYGITVFDYGNVVFDDIRDARGTCQGIANLTGNTLECGIVGNKWHAVEPEEA